MPLAITGLTQLTFLDLSYNALHSLKPGPYLKRLVVRRCKPQSPLGAPLQLGDDGGSCPLRGGSCSRGSLSAVRRQLGGGGA